MEKIYSILIYGIILGVQLHWITAQLNSCPMIEPCVKYTETTCVDGKRTVCIELEDSPQCLLAPGGQVIRNDGALAACIASDPESLVTPAPDAVEGTQGFLPGFPLCKTLVQGDSLLSFGLREGNKLENGSLPGLLNITGNSSPVLCSDYINVCPIPGKKDIMLTFSVGACLTTSTASVTTTSALPTSTILAPVAIGHCFCGDFSDFGACSHTCGGGTVLQRQFCVGSGCPSPTMKTRVNSCNVEACPAPVHGGWSNWTEWTGCSQTCGIGKKQKTRTCNNPPRSIDGEYCGGSDRTTAICVVQSCIVNPPSTTAVPAPVTRNPGRGSRRRNNRRRGNRRRQNPRRGRRFLL